MTKTHNHQIRNVTATLSLQGLYTLSTKPLISNSTSWPTKIIKQQLNKDIQNVLEVDTMIFSWLIVKLIVILRNFFKEEQCWTGKICNEFASVYKQSIFFMCIFYLSSLRSCYIDFGIDTEFRLQDLPKMLCGVGEWHRSGWCQKYTEVRGSPFPSGKEVEAEKLAIQTWKMMSVKSELEICKDHHLFMEISTVSFQIESFIKKFIQTFL